MRNIALFFTILCTITPKSYAQYNVVKDVNFDHIVWDFGKINEDDGVVSHTFRFVYKGNDWFLIKKVSTSCGCTTFEYPDKPLFNEQEGNIKVSFDPNGRPGVFKKKISIYGFNDEEIIYLYITGTVAAKTKPIELDYPFELSESIRAKTDVFSFGYTSRDSVVSKTISIYNTSGHSVKLQQAASTISSFVSISCLPDILNPKEQGEITVFCRLSDMDQQKPTHFELYLLENGTVQKHPLQLFVTLEEDLAQKNKSEAQSRAKLSEQRRSTHRIEDLVGNRARLSLPIKICQFEEDYGEYATQSFILKNTGNDTLFIRDLQPHNISFQWKEKNIPPHSQREIEITIQAIPTEKDTDLAIGYIGLVCNDPVQPYQEIRLLVNCLHSPGGTPTKDIRK